MNRHFSQAIALSVTTLLLFSGAACSLPFQEKKVSAQDLSAQYVRQATDNGAVTETFKNAMSQFSVSLLQNTLTVDTNNDLVSPLSAAQCLALIANGANGNTLTQLEGLFGGMPIAEFNQASYAYTSSLYTANDCQVNLANSLWIQENTAEILPDFLQTNADWYGAQAYRVPFDQTTLSDINHWCYNKTKGKIDKILDSIDRNTVMYLINALDFDAKWQVKYENSDVSNYTFYNATKNTSTVKMLFSDESCYLEDGEDAIGFAKAYKGGKYSFVGILPNESDGYSADIYEYVNGLTGKRWQEMWNNRKSRSVKAGIPEFTYRTNMMLNDALQALGVTDMFDAAVADFSNMSETDALYCSFIKQKTFIQVDRNGTKAAAITLGGMKGTSIAPNEPIRIVLERPFVYAIVDNANGLPLFLGVVSHL